MNEPKLSSALFRLVVRVFTATSFVFILVESNRTLAVGSSEGPSVASTRRPDPVRILTVFSTPLQDGHPLQLLHRQSIRFAADQAYSKWGVLFEKPFALTEVELKACAGKSFEDGVELFVDHQRARLYSDGGKGTVRFKWEGKALALTFGFLESRNVCLQSISVKGASEWIAPRLLVVDGSGALGDGRVFYGEPLTVGVVRQIKWEKPLIVDGLRVWNGDQFAGGSFTAEGRARELEVQIGSEKPVVFSLDDVRGEQSVVLPNPGMATGLTISARSVYPGSVGKNPLLAEVQLLAGGEAWVLFDQNGVSKSDLERMRVIRDKQWDDIFDRELVRDEGEATAESWRFRFRSDGSFFARIFSDRMRLARSWSALGRWELIPNSGEVLQLRLTGSRFVGAENWDSVPCGSTCFKDRETRGPASRRPDLNELPLGEKIEIQRGSKAQLYIRSRERVDKPGLDFTDLKVRIQSLYH